MSDIKIFRIQAAHATELAAESLQVEKSLQKIFEENLSTLLGVRFLASEYTTGPIHKGRIDTLGLDENGCPVIIEYKRAVNENVINQGLYYLDWLMDHKKDYTWLVLEKFGKETARNVDWSAPRLICIAGDFKKYDIHSVKQINRSIELIRYRRYKDDLLVIEMISEPVSTSPAITEITSTVDAAASEIKSVHDPYANQRIAARIAASSPQLKDFYGSISAYLVALGDDIQVKELKNYIAYKKIKNFACLEVFPQAKTVVVYLKIDPSTIALEDGFTRDVKNIGHFGTGDLEVTLRDSADFEKAQALFQKAYAIG